jgi:hypothetical protein
MSQFCKSELNDHKNCDSNSATDCDDKAAKLLDCLTLAVNKQIKSKEKASKAASDFVSQIGDGVTLVSSITDSFKNSQIAIAKFLKNYQAQYRLGEAIAKSYKKLSVNIGIGYKNQQLLGESFQNSLIKVKELGGDVDDVNAIYSKFSDESGRVRILDDEEVERIFAIERATGLMGDSAAALAERFDLMGIGSEQFSDNVNQIMIDSQKIGLNSSKVIKVLSDNFASMQRMSFKGGVKAMTEMSKLAVKMRMDVSDMLGMADKFYEPEAAIEAAAQLQLMGGDIAQAFGDPFETMYLARNKPEELAKRLQTMTENMATLNSETGEFEITAEARQQLSFAAEQLGLAKDNVIDMAFQSNKMKDIKLSVGGDFTEEQLDKISSIAKFKDGQWKVDVGDGSVSVDELSTDELEKAMAAPTDEKDAIKKTAMASMTTNELLDALVKSNEVAIIKQTKIYETLERGLDPLVKAVSDTNKKLVKNAGEAMKDSGFGKKLDEMVKFATNQFNSAASGVAFFNQALDDFKNANLLLGQKQGTPGRAPKGKKPIKDGIVSPVLNTGGDIASFDPGDEFLVGKSGGPLSGYLAEMNQKLNQTIATPTVPSVNTPQKMDIGGTLNFGNINVTIDGSTETSSLSPKERDNITKEIKRRIFGGITGAMDGDKVSGKDAYFGT